MKRISFKKIFCFISFLFILSCCIFYGTRFIKYYLENKKTETIEANTLAKVIRENNYEKDNFKTINGTEYFINNADNNYIMYSNILWRIIKINADNSITAISDSSLTSLAYGEKLNYEESYINKWLNKSEKEYSGILEKHLNKIDSYLQKTTTCLDTIDELNNQDVWHRVLTREDFKVDKPLALMSVEGMCGIKENEEEAVEWMYEHGIRLASLCWNDENALATGVKGNPERGLTERGKNLMIIIVQIKNKKEYNIKMKNITIFKLSHTNEKTFWDIMETSKGLVIATHSNARTLCDHPRNLKDEQIKAIEEKIEMLMLKLENLKG